MVRIGCISDTHNFHDQIVIPECDILCHAGDWTARGTINEIHKFLAWFDKQPAEHLVCIAGNHDFGCQEHPHLVKKLFELYPRIKYLETSSTIIKGVKIHGDPHQPWFHDWSFNLQRGPEIAAKWAQIPDDTDILITHGPPANILDLTERTRENVGCEDLAKRVIQVNPKLHLFGHIHECYGQEEHYGIKFINASICTLQYQPTNPPIVVDI